MKNRVSLHRGKVGSAKHNEHKFYKENADTLSVSFCGNQKDKNANNLHDDELQFYKNRYHVFLEKQNKKHVERRQYKRVKSINDFYENRRYKPSEEIIQYGNIKDTVKDRNVFSKMVMEYIKFKKDFSNKNGNHCHILNASIHFDEATPHVHIREIWDYEKDGIITIGQEEAMRLSGLELPRPNEQVSRTNNRLMTYTAICRNAWQNICEKYGYAVEREPLKVNQKSKNIPAYKAEQERELNDQKSMLTIDKRIVDKRLKELDARENKLLKKEESFSDKEKLLDIKISELEKAIHCTEEAMELYKRAAQIVQDDIDVNFETWAKKKIYRIPRKEKNTIGKMVMVKDKDGKVIWDDHTPYDDYLKDKQAHAKAKALVASWSLQADEEHAKALNTARHYYKGL